ncbi:hypothetical protein [Bosea sp. BK604]|uniref:hypothetical protein n=1 Tax=Bosea sp. BK604 TaxID=2512180 RepID=UPI0010D626E8|nr:hypothetical protein [Bosea sp. BK604]TCR70501.1 hypothetical protein EV560_101908 [Bosea sp. BK604]
MVILLIAGCVCLLLGSRLVSYGQEDKDRFSRRIGLLLGLFGAAALVAGLTITLSVSSPRS